MSQETAVRPGSVTIVVILIWIGFAFTLVGAVSLVLIGTGIASSTPEAIAAELERLDLPAAWAPSIGPILIVSGAFLLVIALIYALFAVFISRGSNVARILIAIIIAIRIIGGIIMMVTGWGTDTWLFSVFLGVALDVAVLFLLFKRSLPPASAARVQSVYNSLSARLGRAATASELTRALNLDRHSIDKDIKQHGADRHSNIGYQSRFRKPKPRVYGVVAAIPQHMREDRSNSQSKRKNREARSSRDASIVRRVHQLSINGNGMGQANNSAYPEKRRFDRSNSRNRSIPESKRSYYNDSRSRRGFKPRYSEHKNYCSLCGKKDHLAKDKCPYMVDESGRQIDIMPVQQTCTLCPENVRPRLNHPEALCPYRKGGPFRRH